MRPTSASSPDRKVSFFRTDKRPFSDVESKLLPNLQHDVGVIGVQHMKEAHEYLSKDPTHDVFSYLLSIFGRLPDDEETFKPGIEWLKANQVKLGNINLIGKIKKLLSNEELWFDGMENRDKLALLLYRGNPV